MGAARKLWVAATGKLAWRTPAHARRMLASFSRTERGSALDMFAAVEATTRRDLRRKYFHHAMDEWRHAQLFAERARELGPSRAVEAGAEEAGLLLEHGIVGGRTLFERLGEEDFLAFVYVAEADAVEQFGVYKQHGMLDERTETMLDRILRDEAFHVSYSRNELERMGADDPNSRSRKAIRRIRLDRFKEGWLRRSQEIGVVVSGLWLVAIYALVVAPFRLLARLQPGGWHAPERDTRTPLEAARSEA